MDREKGFAYCGLACCLCSESASCAGCRNDGCSGKDWCKSFKCCKEKGYNGCWECGEFPCDDNFMLKKPKIHTFAAMLGELGEEKMLELLERNEKSGIIYHYEGGIVGEYDLENTEDIRRLVLGGK